MQLFIKFLSPVACKQRSAMTLVEMMIAMAVGVTILGMATGTTVELYKNFAAAEAYRNVHKEARRSLEYLSHDIRASSSLSNFVGTSEITLNVLNTTGGTDSVNYKLVGLNLQRTVASGGVTFTTNLLTEHVTNIAFERWTNPGIPATNGTTAAQSADTYEIRASLFITNTTVFRVSSDLLQTRAKMRNKQ